jgi:4-diphosphocytidyl-2-C-methyl-D-erythritol kinase
MGINTLYGLELDTAQLLSCAKKIGMDVCYCIIGGLCRISGIGDIVHRLPFQVPDLNLLVATPRIKKPSTAWAYSIIDESLIGKKRSSLSHLLEGIKDQDIKKIASCIQNDFEIPMFTHFPITEQIKNCMKKHGALSTMLAGSGLSIFGIFLNHLELKHAKKALEYCDVDCFYTRTINHTL